jgi:hypothetical protein
MLKLITALILLMNGIHVSYGYTLSPVAMKIASNKCLESNDNQQCNDVAFSYIGSGDYVTAYETAELSCSRGNREGCKLMKLALSKSEEEHQTIKNLENSLIKKVMKR